MTGLFFIALSPEANWLKPTTLQCNEVVLAANSGLRIPWLLNGLVAAEDAKLAG
jgi:hypothetical protein